MIPSWARPGSFCVCKDEDWHDIHSSIEVMGPEHGDIVTIVSVMTPAGREPMIVLAEWGRFYWDISAFRPLTDEEVALHRVALIGDPTFNVHA